MSNQASRKRFRCQAYERGGIIQCSNVATGHIRLPAKVFVCAECRRRWLASGSITFAHTTEPHDPWEAA